MSIEKPMNQCVPLFFEANPCCFAKEKQILGRRHVIAHALDCGTRAPWRQSDDKRLRSRERTSYPVGYAYEPVSMDVRRTVVTSSSQSESTRGRHFCWPQGLAFEIKWPAPRSRPWKASQIRRKASYSCCYTAGPLQISIYSADLTTLYSDIAKPRARLRNRATRLPSWMFLNRRSGRQECQQKSKFLEWTVIHWSPSPRGRWEDGSKTCRRHVLP